MSRGASGIGIPVRALSARETSHEPIPATKHPSAISRYGKTKSPSPSAAKRPAPTPIAAGRLRPAFDCFGSGDAAEPAVMVCSAATGSAVTVDAATGSAVTVAAAAVDAVPVDEVESGFPVVAARAAARSASRRARRLPGAAGRPEARDGASTSVDATRRAFVSSADTDESSPSTGLDSFREPDGCGIRLREARLPCSWSSRQSGRRTGEPTG